MKSLGITALLALGLAVTACSGDAVERRLDDYATRVERVTGVEPAADPGPSVPPPPGPRERILEVEELRIGLFASFSLDRCDLGELVAERNSGLGRTAGWSQRLGYELRFLDRAERCLEELDPASERDATLHERLSEAVASKRRQRDRVLWNATLGSDELAWQLSPAGPLPPWEPAGDLARSSARALAELAAVSRAVNEPGLEPESALADLESQLGALRRDRFAGGALRSIGQLTSTLDRVADAVERREREAPLCPSGSPSAEAEVLRTVFLKFYVGGLQPYLARVHGDTRDWLVSFERLWREQAEAAPPAVRDYVESWLSLETEQGLWRRFERSIDRHTRAWATVLDSCGWAPGQDPPT
jgi:hypothetical protein